MINRIEDNREYNAMRSDEFEELRIKYNIEFLFTSIHGDSILFRVNEEVKNFNAIASGLTIYFDSIDYEEDEFFIWLTLKENERTIAEITLNSDENDPVNDLLENEKLRKWFGWWKRELSS